MSAVSPPPADDRGLTTYGEIADVLSNLRLIVREARRRDRLTLAALAEASGVRSASTIHRFEGGQELSVENVIALLRWLDSSAKEKTDA